MHQAPVVARLADARRTISCLHEGLEDCTGIQYTRKVSECYILTRQTQLSQHPRLPPPCTPGCNPWNESSAEPIDLPLGNRGKMKRIILEVPRPRSKAVVNDMEVRGGPDHPGNPRYHEVRDNLKKKEV